MRIAFIEQEAQLGGVEYTTLRVAQAMDKSKFEPLIICPEDGDLPSLARKAGLDIHIVHRPSFASVSLFLGKRYFANPLGFAFTAVNVFRAAEILYQYLQANPVDIVISKGLLAHFYCGLTARKLNIPCVWYVQEEVDARRAGGLFRLILRQGAKRLPVRVVVDANALLEQFGSPGKVGNTFQVIYNGIDTVQFAPFSTQARLDARREFGIPEDALVIGQVGRLVPLKGQSILLQAFAHLHSNFPNSHLLFVGAPLFGDGKYEQVLQNYAAQQGLKEKVHFTGFIPDVRQGLAAMDIVVHASVETDSPVSVTESMSCGLPTAVSAVRGMTELVVQESDALVFPPGDFYSLSLTLARLLGDEELRSELGRQARESVIRKYSLKASVTKLEELMEEVYAT